MSLKREDILIVPGMEISSAMGHILAYNVQEEVPRGLEVAETIDLIRAQGGIAVAAHPYRMWSGLGEEVTVSNDFDAIEVHNGRSTRAHNDMAARLAVRLCKPFTAGSDSHELYTVGDTYFVSSQDCHTVEEVIKDVLSGSGTTEGAHRPRSGTISYGAKCIGEWLGRGFKKM
jgi:predicted metal-dependent phosphoesterase TrpH